MDASASIDDLLEEQVRLFKAFKDLDTFNNVVEALKPVTLVSTLVRMASNISAVEYGRDLCILAELYGPLLRDNWSIIEGILSSIRDRFTSNAGAPENRAPLVSGGEQTTQAAETPSGASAACGTARDFSIDPTATLPPFRDQNRRTGSDEPGSLRGGEDVTGRFARIPDCPPKTGHIDDESEPRFLPSWFSLHAGGAAQGGMGAVPIIQPAPPVAIVAAPKTCTCCRCPVYHRNIGIVGPCVSGPAFTHEAVTDWFLEDIQRAAQRYVENGDGQFPARTFWENTKVVAQMIWYWSRDAIVALCAGLMTAFAALGGLFPGTSALKRISDKMLGIFSGMSKLKSSSVSVNEVFSAVRGSFEKSLGDEESEAWIAPLNWIRTMASGLDTTPHVVHHPNFPMEQIERILAKLEKDGAKDRTPYGSWLRSEADKVRIVRDKVLEMRRESPARPQPVVLVLAGKPGVGKTTFVKGLVETLSSIFGVKGADSWQCGLDHQDQLTGKPVLVMEEFGLSDLVRDTAALQRLADTSSYVTDCDLIKNKGRSESPAVIVVVTNHENIYHDCKFPGAVSRRIDCHILMSHTGLAAWKLANPSRNPCDAEKAVIFAGLPSTLEVLPAGAIDWTGNYFSEGQVLFSRPTATTAARVTGNAHALVSHRWGDILDGKVVIDHFNVRFHAGNDAAVTLLIGPPGTGKSTVAELVDGAVVINDPWTSDRVWADTVSVVMHAEEGGEHIIITTNEVPWQTRLNAMGEEEQRAFLRRINLVVEFGFNKWGFFGKYSHAHVKSHGWSRAVWARSQATGNLLTYHNMLSVLRARRPDPRCTTVLDPLVHRAAYDSVGSTSITTAQMAALPPGMGVLRHFTLSRGACRLIPLMGRLMAQIPRIASSDVDGFVGDMTPRGLVAMVNDMKLEGELSPCSVAFADVTLNFFAEGGRLRVAVVEDDQDPSERAALAAVSAPPCMSTEAKTICRTIGMLVLTVSGITCTALAARYAFHSPTVEESQNGIGASDRRVLERVSDATLWTPKGDPWHEGGAAIDYTEVVRFDSIGSSIIPCTSKTGALVGWAFVHAGGVVVNKHVYAQTSHLGPRKVGECLATALAGSDFSILKPRNDPGYKKSKIPFSVPVLGELLSQVGQSGKTIQTAKVTGRARVSDANGKNIEVFILDSSQSEPGDCGLPWVRHVGQVCELAGLHTGLRGGFVMITAVVPQVMMHGGGDKEYTAIKRTQYFGVDDCVEDLAPSSKVWPDEYKEGKVTSAAMSRRAAEVFFPVSTRSNAVCERAVNATIRYIEHLVPESELTRWGLAATIMSLDMSTSAGPSYKCAKNRVFSEVGEVLPAHSRTFWAGLRGQPEAKCMISLKDELRPLKKREAGMTRPIFVFDAHATVAVKQLVGSGLVALAKGAGSHPWCPGISYLNGGWAQMCEALGKFPYLLDADFSRWDSTNSHPLLKQGIRVLSHLAPKEDRPRLVEWWNALLQAETQHGIVRTGLPSGVIGTAQLNCTSHVLVVNDILEEQGRAFLGEMGCPVAIFCYGDDILIGSHDRALAQRIVTGWEERGFQATSADKSGPPKIVRLGELQFLKRRLVRREGDWRAPLEIKSIWRALSFARHHVAYDHTRGMQDMEVLDRRAVNVFQSAFSEFWQHGEAVFTEARQRLICFAKERGTRLPVVIPDYARFCPRDVLAEANADLGDSGVEILTVAFHVGGKTEVMASAPQASEGPVMAGSETGSGGAATGTVVGAVTVAAPLAEPTPGIETTMGTTGGEMTVIDPTIRSRFAPTPGGTLSIRTGTPTGQILWSTRVTPDMNAFTKYLASMYNAWCGGFDVMIVIGANNFIGGKIVAIYTPPSRDPNNYSLDELLCFDHTVLDIRMMDNVVLACSDIKNVLWHRVADTGVDGCAGYFTLALMTNLVTAGNAGIEMSLDLRIFSRPSLNFDFRMLVPPASSSITGETIGTWMATQGKHLSWPSIAVNGTPATALAVMSSDAPTVAGNLWAGVSGLNGPEGTWCVPTGATCSINVKCISSGVTGTFWVGVLDPTGNVHDPSNTGETTNLPVEFPSRLPAKTTTPNCFLSWSADGVNHLEEATMSFVAQQQHLRVVCTRGTGSLSAANAMLTWVPSGVLSRADGGLGIAPSFTPPNGESFINFVAGGLAGVLLNSLTTVEASAQRVRDPVRVTPGTAALFNLRDASGSTNLQAKLYENGVLTTGGTKTAVLYVPPWKFEYVGEVSYDYKLKSPAGGLSVRTQEIERSLLAWLRSQRESAPPSSELDRLLEVLSGLRILPLAPRETSRGSSWAFNNPSSTSE